MLTAVVAPTTLVTGLAFYFGWRREEAFAGYFGIDPSTLGLSTSDYVLRSVDALFVPIVVVLLVVFAAACARLAVGSRFGIGHRAAPALAVVGAGALVVGFLLVAGHAVSSSGTYLQALCPAVGAVLVAEALVQWRPEGAGLAAVRTVAVAIVLVSVFWATSEYATDRGLREARRLAADLTISPQATIYSARNLDIEPKRFGGACPAVVASRLARGEYPYRYQGLTLLLRSGGKYFFTPTPVDPGSSWDPSWGVLLIPDDGSVRVELARGVDYSGGGERTAAGHLAFTC